jgi:hypothetical protein
MAFILVQISGHRQDLATNRGGAPSEESGMTVERHKVLKHAVAER